MPIERQYARRLLGKRQYDACVKWQEITRVEYNTELSEYERYERCRWWTRALTLGRRLGVLDRSNEPTFAVPNWNALPRKDREYLCATARSNRALSTKRSRNVT